MIMPNNYNPYVRLYEKKLIANFKKHLKILLLRCTQCSEFDRVGYRHISGHTKFEQFYVVHLILNTIYLFCFEFNSIDLYKFWMHFYLRVWNICDIFSVKRNN